MFGIPLLPFLALCFLIILSGVVGILALGLVKGLVLPVVFIGMLIALRVACENDSRAPQRLFWRMRGLLLRLVWGRSAALLSVSCGGSRLRHKNVERFFKALAARSRVH